MKAIYLIFISLSISALMGSLNAYGQEKKYKARLSVEYYHIVGKSRYIEVASKFKEQNGYEPSKNLRLNVYKQITEDSVAFKSEIITNEEGLARFILTEPVFTDTLLTHAYYIKIEGSKRFKNAEKNIRFIEAQLKAQLLLIDSINTIKAKLTDAVGSPIEGERLKINIQRLFAPLAIGKSYKTDEVGQILVPLHKTFTGVDGQIIFEVFMDSKKYGNVVYYLYSDIAEPIIDKSTYDQRTLWSPPTKSPLFLLISPNLLLAGIWFVIFLLARNMYKIYKC